MASWRLAGFVADLVADLVRHSASELQEIVPPRHVRDGPKRLTDLVADVRVDPSGAKVSRDELKERA